MAEVGTWQAPEQQRLEADATDANVQCPVCNCQHLLSLLTLNQMPVLQNVIFGDQSDALGVPRGDIKLVYCMECGLAFNKSFLPSAVVYGQTYDNRQSQSPRFAEYLAGRVRHLLDNEHVRGCKIVEIGCGDGTFIRALVDDPGIGNSGAGFDPSHLGPTQELDGRLRFHHRYFEQADSMSPADVVICRHVIEHIAAPFGLFSAIEQSLALGEAGRVYIETPRLAWKLHNNAVWDFPYEQCCWFDLTSLAVLLGRVGMKIDAYEEQLDGQYLWVRGSIAPREAVPAPPAHSLDDSAAAFGRWSDSLIAETREQVGRLSDLGRIALWGAAGKGVMFANIVDPTATLFTCVVDMNPRKQGSYVPGTGHAIVSPESLIERRIAGVLVINPAYRQEIEVMLQGSTISTYLVDQRA